MKYEVFKEAVKINNTQRILEDAISFLENLGVRKDDHALLDCIKSLKETNPSVFTNLKNFFYEQIGILVDKREKL